MFCFRNCQNNIVTFLSYELSKRCFNAILKIVTKLNILEYIRFQLFKSNLNYSDCLVLWTSYPTLKLCVLVMCLLPGKESTSKALCTFVNS